MIIVMIEHKRKIMIIFILVTNYRYQGYQPDGGLIETQVNISNANILEASTDKPNDNTVAKQKAGYKASFSKMSNYLEVL